MPSEWKVLTASPLVSVFFSRSSDPRLHLAGSLVGKSDRSDVLRLVAVLLDQVRDLMRNHARLAAAGAGQHQQRTVEVRNGFALHCIEFA